MKVGVQRAVPLQCVFVCAVVFVAALAQSAVFARQGLDRVQRERVQQMLTNIRNEIKKKYYDPTFKGRDIDAHFEAAAKKIESATSLGHGLAIIAQALIDFDDSHLYFVPPNRTTRVEYGWQMQMIGDDAFVTAVRPGSDAAARGLKAGDQILALEGRRPLRKDLWKMEYLYYTLNPKPTLRLQVASPGAAPHPVEIAAKVTQGKRVIDLTGADGGVDFDAMIRDLESFDRPFRTVRHGDVVFWQFPTFLFDPEAVDQLVDESTRNARGLVLDLRGNGGGYIKTLERFAGRFFDRDVTIATLHGRKPMQPILARRRGKTTLTMPLVVLIDSRSGSAAELFARLVQIEKRGTVIGDRSSGAVMQATSYNGQMGADRVVLYAASITDANVLMTDGQSLEVVGVTPDELLVPSAADLAAGRDPVLARASVTLGAPLDAAVAGKLFPVEWR